MPRSNAVWGIEVGQCALKAMKLRPAPDGQVELVAFDLIEHPKLLSQPDADPEELIKAAIEKFVSRNDWRGDSFVIGVPGQQTFSRFCKLPPVDEKKIPDIVRFEASQQIPFDMDDVVWDYEVFRAEGSPDVEVGIFAMRKDLVRKHIEYFTSHGINPSIIQALPSALYNFCRFDGQGGSEQGKATVIIDVGAQKTDLIIVEPNSAWSRNIPLGGNNFTEALVKAFKLSFAKAESLKRTAATSKYARQIFQAMRPVFAELVAEVQRSLGFYSSTHREIELHKVLACGNAFRLPGLQKYLENNLTIPGGVFKLDKFAKLVPSQTANAPQFTENLLSFGPAYGLAIQGLGQAKISANLLPPDLARVALWKQKQPYFVAAAASLLLAAALPWTRNWLDAAALAANREAGDQAARIINEARRLKSEFEKARKDTGDRVASVERLFQLQSQKDLLPAIMTLVHQAAPRLPEFERASSPEEIRKLIASNPTRYSPRTARRQVWIEAIQIEYAGNIDARERSGISVSAGDGYAGGIVDDGGFNPRGAGPRGGMGPMDAPAVSGGGAGDASAPGFLVHVVARMPFGTEQSEAIKLITGEFYENLRKLGNRPGQGFYIPEQDPKNVGDRNRNLGLPLVNRYQAEAGRGAPFGGAPGYVSPRMGGDPRMAAGGDVIGDAGADLGAASAGPAVEKGKDPMTGEDWSTDWKVEFSFKIKLGEPPQQEPAEQPAGAPAEGG